MEPRTVKENFWEDNQEAQRVLKRISELKQEVASHLSSSGNFSFRWEAKASPTPKEVLSFIVVRLARANSETKSKNPYW